MRLILATILSLVFSAGALASEAVELRHKGVEAASKGDFASAQKYLEQSAKLGFYTAQVEYAYLLESSPDSVQNRTESYAWYKVVVARAGADTEFAKEGLARLTKVMSKKELNQAKETTTKYIAQYAK
jgi:TPR repeat protein